MESTTETITNTVKQDMERAYEENELEGCQQVIQKKLEQWRHTPMKMAITGQSGAGKSTLINALRGLSADDDGAAPVGSTETTKTISEYPHPDNDQLVFSDLPGVGTTKFPKQSYIDEISADKFDFFLLLAQKRFLETDMWLAEELLKRKKGFFLVRTHMAEEVANDKRAHPKSQCTEVELVAQIRVDMETHLSELGTATPTSLRVFLIDSHEQGKYDFPDLQRQLIDNFPALKQEALLLSLGATNRAMVDQKAKCLKSRIWKAAAMSAGIAAVPIPGTSLAADIAILLHETRFYFHQFGLDTTSLRRLALWSEVKYNELDAVVTREFGVDVMTLEAAKFLEFTAALRIPLGAFAAESVAEEVVNGVPTMGVILSASMSFLTTYWFLRQILDKMHAVAGEVYDLAKEQQA